MEYAEYIEWIQMGCPIREDVFDLDISQCDLAVIDPDICNLVNLKNINISKNQIAFLPDSFFKLFNLETFVAFSNNFKTVSDKFSCLMNLKFLDFSENQLTTIECDFKLLKNLNFVGFSGNKITTFPSSIGYATKIKHMDISNNELVEIPESIGDIESLENLDVSYNKLVTIPPKIGSILFLKLNVVGNNLTYIPANVCHLLEMYESYIQPHFCNEVIDAKFKIIKLLVNPPVISTEKVIESVFFDTTLSDEAKKVIIQFYSHEKDTISNLNLTFIDVFCAVWNRIMCERYPEDLKRWLSHDLESHKSRCSKLKCKLDCKSIKCKINTIINCLVNVC
jgi:Leucine-rich repeat (LRR) protein